MRNKGLPSRAHPLRFIAAAMHFSRANARGRNPCRRGFCDRPPQDDQAGARGGGFVSSDSHLRSVRNANYGYRQVAWVPRGPPQQPFRPFQPAYRPPTPPEFQPFSLPYSERPVDFRPPHPHFRRPPSQPRPPDHRYWVFSESQPPTQCEKFTVLSYNILADYLAMDHRDKLYFHIPHYILNWESRKRRLLLEFGLWSPDIMCLQEVDHFHDLQQELASRGYAGVWKMRTGNATDGCAVFWRTDRFQLRHEEMIEYCQLGLRDNVAQILVLESRTQKQVEHSLASLPGSCDQLGGDNQVVICNIHVLYNPKRGEIKLGQVRVLLEQAYAVSQRWNNAPVIICGDFNCTPKSPLYNYISEQKLSLSGLARNLVSGQYVGSVRAHPPMNSFRGMTTSRVKDSNSLISDNQNNPQCGTRNVSPAEKSHPQVSSNTLDVSAKSLSGNSKTNEASNTDRKRIGEDILGRQHIQYTDCRLVNPSKGTFESSDELGRTHFHGEKDEQLEHVEMVSCYSDGQFQAKGSSADFVGTSDFHMKAFSESAAYCSDYKVRKEDMESCILSTEAGIGHCSTYISPEKTMVVDSVLQNRISVIEFSSIDVSSGPSPACVGLPTIGNKESPVDLSDDQHTSSGGSYENASLSYTSDLSITPTLLQLEKNFSEEFGALKIEDISSHGRVKNIGFSGEESSECRLACFTPDNVDIYQNPSKLVAEEISEALEESANGDEANRMKSEEHIGVGEGDDMVNVLCSSEENPDPNFLNELLGLGDKSALNSHTIEEGGDLEGLKSSYVSRSDMDSFHEEVQEDAAVAVSRSFEVSYDPYLWTPTETEIASGNADSNFVEHNLSMRSAYRDVKDYAGTKDPSGEPEVTSYNRQFMGTVDYIWYSEGLQTVKVLDTIPKHVLQQTPGFPTKRWGSDHLALVCQLAFTKGLTGK